MNKLILLIDSNKNCNYEIAEVVNFDEKRSVRVKQIFQRGNRKERIDNNRISRDDPEIV